ncbi:MAG: type II toxin-antitoxin system RatA family toxin [Hyphomicrobiales bacterium]|nr:type II toxin-antitoxin system RatA family toxin [Hyphomicrobiales bacterium]MCP5371191.1 type II toxin-antitoxin system RatA family toxin [Hyphomicrobiales bacterium]
MQRTVRHRFDQFTAEQLFAVASDIESYPDFIPHCVGARIRRRDGNDLVVDNLFAAGPARLRFTTHALFDPPRAIDITGTDGPFEHLRIAWRFTPQAGGGTVAEFTLETRFRRRLMARLSRLVTDHAERRVLDAFRRRAERAYGAGGDQSSRVDR